MKLSEIWPGAGFGIGIKEDKRQAQGQLPVFRCVCYSQQEELFINVVIKNKSTWT